MTVTTGFGARIRRLIPASLGAWLVRPGSAGVDAARWNAEYAGGTWDTLDSLFEMPRYAVIAGYCRRNGGEPPASVLDIGCGSGLLQRWLALGGRPGRYLGLDLSETAIEQARARAAKAPPGSEPARFRVADAAHFAPEPGETFDTVVLNEMLYYLEDPATLVRRCTGVLAPGGTLLISMWRSPHALATWRRVAPLLAVQDEIRLRRPRSIDGRPARDAEWHIRLCRPRRPSTA